MVSAKQQLLASIFQRMFVIRREVEQSFTSSFEDKIGTVLQLQALQFLKEIPHMTVGELAEKLHMSSPAIAQFTGRLSHATLIVRDNDVKDRRITRLSLTRKGEEELEHLRSLVQNKIASVFGHLPVEDLEQLLKILTKVSDSLDTKR